MATELKVDLHRNAINGLEQLVQMNLDSADGFHFAAQKVDDDLFITIFSEISLERRRQAEELEIYLTINLNEPHREGILSAALYRCWLACRQLLESNKFEDVLIEAERGEDKIKKAYEQVIQQTAGSTINELLIDQFRRVCGVHEQLQTLREALMKPAE